MNLFPQLKNTDHPLPVNNMAWSDPVLAAANYIPASSVSRTGRPANTLTIQDLDTYPQYNSTDSAVTASVFADLAGPDDLPYGTIANTFGASSSDDLGIGNVPATLRQLQEQYPSSIVSTVPDYSWAPLTDQTAMSAGFNKIAIQPSQTVLGYPLDDNVSFRPAGSQSYAQNTMTTQPAFGPGSQPTLGRLLVPAPPHSLGPHYPFPSVNAQLYHTNQRIAPSLMSGPRLFLTPRAFPNDPSKIPYIRGAVSGIAMSVEGTELSMLHVLAEAGNVMTLRRSSNAATSLRGWWMKS